MKKLLSIMLALIMSLSVATLFTACEEELEEGAHAHIFSTVWQSDETHHWHNSDCGHEGIIVAKTEHTYGEDNKCTVCGVEKVHEHTYGDAWASDETHHWHKATCEHVDEIKDKAEHIYGSDNKCTVCGIEEGHEHTYENTWTRDEDYHWHQATCGHIEQIKDKAAHTFGENDRCTVCNKKIWHIHTYESTWSTDENYHWRKATCEHVDEIKDKGEHTCDADGKCTVCNLLVFYDAEVTPEQWLSNFNKVENMTNLRFTVVTYRENGDIDSTNTYEIDGDKWHNVWFDPQLPVNKGYSETIINKTGVNSYDVYEWHLSTNNFTKETDQTEIEYEVEDMKHSKEGLATFGLLVKDKYTQATFDEREKTYTVNLGDIYFQGENFEDMIYELSFVNGELTNINISGNMLDDRDRYYYAITFEFGGVTVEIPQV